MAAKNPRAQARLKREAEHTRAKGLEKKYPAMAKRIREKADAEHAKAKKEHSSKKSGLVQRAVGAATKLFGAKPAEKPKASPAARKAQQAKAQRTGAANGAAIRKALGSVQTGKKGGRYTMVNGAKHYLHK